LPKRKHDDSEERQGVAYPKADPSLSRAVAGYASKKATAKGAPNLALLLTPAIPVVMELATNFVSKKASTAGDCPIANAAVKNDSPALEDLLEKDPYADRVPAIVAAAAKGKMNALDILLNTPKVPRSNKHHHHYSNVVGRETQEEWLNSWVNAKTPLLAAVEHKHIKTTEFLLESGADPNLCPKRGTSALQMAARAGDLEIVRSLVSYGANVNRQDSAGDTPLIIAARWDLFDVARCLVENGANMDIRNDKGGTAILVAARHDCVDVVELLARKGADLRVQDKKGQSVLHRAVEGRYLVEQVPASVKKEMLKVLLEAGADPRLKDNQGRTAAQAVTWMEGG
jgi:hypothetical protein